MPTTLFTLVFVWMNSAVPQFDDPKIYRMIKAMELGDLSSDDTVKRGITYPSIQLGYTYGKSFGLIDSQGENTMALYAWPWQHKWRAGIGVELGMLTDDPGGHVGVSLAFGYQRYFPLHWYVDVTMMGGVYRINLYQAEVLAPITKVGLHGGVGISYARLHCTIGLLVEKTDLFLSSGTLSGTSFGFEFRVGF